jgi:hypothetical protein
MTHGRTLEVGHSCALSTSILTPMAVWKVKIANAAGGGNRDRSSGPSSRLVVLRSDFVWLGVCTIHIVSCKNSPGDGSWTGWTLNDEAIFKLETIESALKMWHKRLDRMFTNSLPPKSEGSRLHIGVHGTNITCIHVTIPSADEMQPRSKTTGVRGDNRLTSRRLAHAYVSVCVCVGLLRLPFIWLS